MPKINYLKIMHVRGDNSVKCGFVPSEQACSKYLLPVGRGIFILFRLDVFYKGLDVQESKQWMSPPPLTHSTLGKLFSRRHMNLFFLFYLFIFFSENRF